MPLSRVSQPSLLKVVWMFQICFNRNSILYVSQSDALLYLQKSQKSSLKTCCTASSMLPQLIYHVEVYDEFL